MMLGCWTQHIFILSKAQVTVQQPHTWLHLSSVLLTTPGWSSDFASAYSSRSSHPSSSGTLQIPLQLHRRKHLALSLTLLSCKQNKVAYEEVLKTFQYSNLPSVIMKLLHMIILVENDPSSLNVPSREGVQGLNAQSAKFEMERGRIYHRCKNLMIKCPHSGKRRGTNCFLRKQ